MDASAQVICGKSQKLETEEGRNLIRNIPDVILFPPNERCCHSILSKRWKNLWMSVPNLDFEEEGIFGDRVHFMNFVERVMMLCSFSDTRTSPLM
jgi:hypothetical protein